jgi:hypothetical protein
VLAGRVVGGRSGFGVKNRGGEGVGCAPGPRCRRAVWFRVKTAATTEVGARSARVVGGRSGFGVKTAATTEVDARSARVVGVAFWFWGENRANDGVGCLLGSRCRLTVFPGETATVESVFWVERTGLYVALATQTPVLTSTYSGRTGLYVAPATYRPVRSRTHAAGATCEGTQLRRWRGFHPEPTRDPPAKLPRQRRRASLRSGRETEAAPRPGELGRAALGRS